MTSAEHAQARYAERLTVDADPAEATVRHVALDGRPLGKIVFDGESTWALLLLIDGGYDETFDHVLAPRDDTDTADLHAISGVAWALADGTLREHDDKPGPPDDADDGDR